MRRAVKSTDSDTLRSLKVVVKSLRLLPSAVKSSLETSKSILWHNLSLHCLPCVRTKTFNLPRFQQNTLPPNESERTALSNQEEDTTWGDEDGRVAAAQIYGDYKTETSGSGSV